VLRKPVLSALALLAYVKPHRHTVHWLGGPHVEAAQAAAIAKVGAIASSTADQTELSVLLYRSADAEDATPGTVPTTVTITLSPVPFHGNATIATYMLNGHHGGATAAWEAMGRPSYPTPSQICKLRQAARLAPVAITHVTGATMVADGGLTLRHSLDLPAVHLSHVCSSALASQPPPPVERLVLRAAHATSQTDATVVLSWQSGAGHGCVRGFVVLHSATRGGSYVQVNEGYDVFLSFTHAQQGEAPQGCYRVVAVDYWGHQGAFAWSCL